MGWNGKHDDNRDKAIQVNTVTVNPVAVISDVPSDNNFHEYIRAITNIHNDVLADFCNCFNHLAVKKAEKPPAVEIIIEKGTKPSTFALNVATETSALSFQGFDKGTCTEENASEISATEELIIYEAAVPRRVRTASAGMKTSYTQVTIGVNADITDYKSKKVDAGTSCFIELTNDDLRPEERFINTIAPMVGPIKTKRKMVKSLAKAKRDKASTKAPVATKFYEDETPKMMPMNIKTTTKEMNRLKHIKEIL